mmetsp:Transcript_127761/g.409063  ORF Transcript_127761/g.409063 Transcript_127761/m.409063 type:complete len:218 (-) Transcript_127761:652-1305(-)
MGMRIMSSSARDEKTRPGSNFPPRRIKVLNVAKGNNSGTPCQTKPFTTSNILNLAMLPTSFFRLSPTSSATWSSQANILIKRTACITSVNILMRASRERLVSLLRFIKRLTNVLFKGYMAAMMTKGVKAASPSSRYNNATPTISMKGIDQMKLRWKKAKSNRVVSTCMMFVSDPGPYDDAAGCDKRSVFSKTKHDVAPQVRMPTRRQLMMKWHMKRL